MTEKTDGLDQPVTRRYFDKVLERIDSRFQHVDKKFDQIDYRFDQIDKRFEKNDKKMISFEKRMDGFNDRMDGFQRYLEAMEERINQRFDEFPTKKEFEKYLNIMDEAMGELRENRRARLLTEKQMYDQGDVLADHEKRIKYLEKVR